MTTNNRPETWDTVYQLTGTKAEIRRGTQVFVPMENASGVVVNIHADAHLQIEFDDGEEGTYAPNEVEVTGGKRQQ